MHYKFLKKIIGIIGFKLIDKNLVKNERILSRYSDLSLEKLLDNLFLNSELKSVIQIGANDGQRFDVLEKFIKKYSPFVIFLEPIKSYFNDLKKKYSNNNNLIFENLAITVNNEISQLYKVKDDKLKYYDEHVMGISSFKKEHLIKHGIKKNHIIKVDVQSITIKKLLQKHSVKNLDLIMIDTEGYDGHIVIDFLKNIELRPIIIFEFIHIKNMILEDALKKLKNKDYFFFKIEENIICIPREKSKNLQLN